MSIKTGFVSVKAGWQDAAYLEAMRESSRDEDLDMVVIRVKRDGSAANLFRYEHRDWCLHCFESCLQVFKGLYFYRLQKMGWRWLKT